MYGKNKRSKYVRRGLEGWIMTYGDMMSLLLTFFILIVSFSSIQESKFDEAISSLRQAFGVLSDQSAVMESPRPPVPETPLLARTEVIPELRRLERSLLVEGLAETVGVESTVDGIAFRISAPFLFASGEATLKAETREVLDRLAEFCAQFGHEMRVEGHTDAVPIKTSRYPSNWHLSAARAVAVAELLQEAGIPPERISATGYGEFRPVADNATPAGQAANRRVEIFLTLAPRPIVSDGLPLQAIVPIAAGAGADP